MRTITFNPMIESMSGNLRTRQGGSINFGGLETPGVWYLAFGDYQSNNYKATICANLGHSGSRRGKQWFSIRTKVGSHVSDGTKMAMAAFGGAAALYAGIVANSTVYQALLIEFNKPANKAKYSTFQSFVTRCANLALYSKDADIQFESSTTKVKNPWIEGGTGTTITISAATIAKFASYLSAD